METTTPSPKIQETIQTPKKSIPLIPIIFVITILLLLGGGLYWNIARTRIAIDNAEISAPTIELAAQQGGILNDMMVGEGDLIRESTVVARVGDELIKTKIAGIITGVHNDIGKTFKPGEPIVEMIDPTELRVEGRIDESKGLRSVHVGQSVLFTVDTFGSRKYQGIIDEVSPVSRDLAVVFSISDKRETKEFTVKARFNVDQYPELKKGMSAKMTILLQ